MPRPAYIDPAFPAALRALRSERGLSVRELARRAYVAKSTISELENGVKRPGPDMAAALDRALDAGGSLTAMVHPAGDMLLCELRAWPGPESYRR